RNVTGVQTCALPISSSAEPIAVRFSGTHPTRAYPTDAGWDLSSSGPVVVPVRAIVKVRTGTFVDLPPGSYGMICSRSGLVANHGLAVANAPGIIDSGRSEERRVGTGAGARRARGARR